MRYRATRAGALAVVAGALAALGCAGAGPAGAPGNVGEAPGAEVVFSVANADRATPVAVIEVRVDDRTVVYGPFAPSEGGDYLYVAARLPERKARIRAVSRAGSETVEAEKWVIIEDHLWIVVTRLREYAQEPAEIVIDVSYEKKRPWDDGAAAGE